MSIRIGTIQVDLLANTVSFSNAMTKASSIALTSSKNIQRSLSLIGVEAAAMAASVIGSLEEVIRRSEDFAFSIQRAASQVGTSSEQFSKLAFNAKLAGIPLETLRSAMERLSRSTGSALGGNKEAAAAYATLGISVKDLKGPLKDSGDLFVAVSKSLDKFKDSTAKTYIEQKILGRAGAELAPLLHQVATGFDTASKQAELFGVVIGDKSAAQALALHQSMVQLESVLLGFSLRLLSGVSPALKDVANKMVDMATSANGMKTIDSIASSVATTVRVLGDAFQFLFEHATAVKNVLISMAAIRVAGMFAPMIAGALGASTAFGTVGIASLKMIGNVFGITQLAKVFTPVIAGARATVASFAAIAAEEGVLNAILSAGVVAWINLKAAMFGVTGVLGLLTAGLGVFAYTLNDSLNKAQAASAGAARWGDIWSAALDQVSNKMLEFKLLWDAVNGKVDAEDVNTAKMIKQYGLLGQTLDQVAAARANARDKGTVNYGNGESTYGHKGHPGGDKLDAPSIVTPKAEKVDIVKLKMLELADASDQAREALQNAGQNVDFDRLVEATGKANKIIDELNIRLAAKGKALTEDEMTTIRVAVATEVNDNAQAKFLDTIEKGTQTIVAQAKAHDLLTAAMGKGAAATREAQVNAQINQKYANASDTFKNSDRGKADIANERIALSKEMAAADAQADAQALIGVQQQINAETNLNRVMLSGRDIREQAALANEQAAIAAQYATRGDTTGLQEALAANQKLYELKRQQADLSRASSMDPAQAFRDEALAIQDAAQAARDAGVAISDMQLAAANKSNWESYLAAIDKVTLAVGDASDGVSLFFRQMSRDTISGAQQVMTILGGAFESVNESVVRLVEIQTKTYHEFILAVRKDFSDMFRNIAGQLAKLGLQKAEQGIVGAILGKTGKGDQSPTVAAIAGTNSLLTVTNSILTSIATSGGMAGGLGATTAGNFGTGSDNSSGSTAGGVTAGLVSTALGMFGLGGFGGHRALGGDVTAGVSYDVGEMGRETFTPTVNGRITPHNKTGNGTTTIHIDASGSTDPAQTQAAVHRGIMAAAPHLMAGAVNAVQNKRNRSPMSSH